MPRRGPRRRLRSLAYTLLSLALVVLVAEGVVRLLGLGDLPGYPPGLFVADEPMAYRMRPDVHAPMDGGAGPVTLRTDDRGLRVVAPRDEPAPGTPRVLVLGDSFPFGHGVEAEDTFAARLEQRLSDAEPVRVDNAGVPGHGTHNAVGMARALLPELRPDVVLHCVYVGNDFGNDLVERFGRLTARSGVLVALDEDGGGDLVASARSAIVVHSRLVSFLAKRLVALTMSPEDVVRRLCDDLEWGQGFGVATLRRTWSDDARAAYERTVGHLRELSGLCRAADVPLVVALLPGPLQYDDESWAQAVLRCGLDPDAFERDRPNRMLASLGTDELGADVPIVDLLPAFRRAPTEPRLFIDVHFSPAGHRLAAEVLEPTLRAVLSR